MSSETSVMTDCKTSSLVNEYTGNTDVMNMPKTAQMVEDYTGEKEKQRHGCCKGDDCVDKSDDHECNKPVTKRRRTDEEGEKKEEETTPAHVKAVKYLTSATKVIAWLKENDVELWKQCDILEGAKGDDSPEGESYVTLRFKHIPKCLRDAMRLCVAGDLGDRVEVVFV